MIKYYLLFYYFVTYIILCPVLIKILKFNSIIIQMLIFILISLINLIIFDFDNLISIWINFCIFAFFVCFYIFIYGALETSISIKILHKLAGRNFSLEEITNKIVKKSLLKRISTLVSKNMIIKKNNYYSLTIKGLKIIKVIIFIRKIFKLKNLGFYK